MITVAVVAMIMVAVGTVAVTVGTVVAMIMVTVGTVAVGTVTVAAVDISVREAALPGSTNILIMALFHQKVEIIYRLRQVSALSVSKWFSDYDYIISSSK
jgi:hypothetical protein